MSQVMKHVGKMGEKPCIVIFRELPGEPENCLIVSTGSLGDRHHDDMMSVIQSPEAQQSNNVSQVLDRRQFTDGENILSYLHYNKKLQKVPVSQINLTPTPSNSIPLAEVNAEIRKIEGGYTPPKTDGAHLNNNPTTAPVVNESSDDAAQPSEAQSLIFQAQLMKEDAERMVEEADAKLQQAYSIDPTLEPKKRGRPKKATSDK